MPDRIENQYFTGAANTDVQYFEFPFLQGRRSRTLRSVFVGNTTAKNFITIRVSATDYISIDFTRFGTAEGPVSLNIPVTANDTVFVGLRDGSGAGFTDLPVMLGYDL